MMDAPTTESSAVPDIHRSDFGNLVLANRTEVWTSFHSHLNPDWLSEGVRAIILAEVRQLFPDAKPDIEVYALLDEHTQTCLSLVFDLALPDAYAVAVGTRLCAIRHLIRTGQLVMPPLPMAPRQPTQPITEPAPPPLRWHNRLGLALVRIVRIRPFPRFK